MRNANANYEKVHSLHPRFRIEVILRLESRSRTRNIHTYMYEVDCKCIDDNDNAIAIADESKHDNNEYHFCLITRIKLMNLYVHYKWISHNNNSHAFFHIDTYIHYTYMHVLSITTAFVNIFILVGFWWQDALSFVDVLWALLSFISIIRTSNVRVYMRA